MLASILLTSLLLVCARSTPISHDPLQSLQAGEKVQGALGTDEYWNTFDGGLNTYTFYSGNGSAAAGWPSRLQWLSFNDMWTVNKHLMTRSCSKLYEAPNNSDDEMQALYDTIQTVSHQTMVDHRFILATIMQETKGCVRAKTTVSPDGKVRNPGLLQDHDGSHSCNENGKIQTPCPKDQILGMVLDGVAGTTNGKGFVSLLNEQDQNTEFAEAHYRVARLYNSGAVDPSGDLGKGVATHCYSSDIANRLVGYVDAETHCLLDRDDSS